MCLMCEFHQDTLDDYCAPQRSGVQFERSFGYPRIRVWLGWFRFSSVQNWLLSHQLPFSCQAGLRARIDLVNNKASHNNLVNSRTPNHLGTVLTKVIMAEEPSGELSSSRDDAISRCLWANWDLRSAWSVRFCGLHNHLLVCAYRKLSNRLILADEFVLTRCAMVVAWPMLVLSHQKHKHLVAMTSRNDLYRRENCTPKFQIWLKAGHDSSWLPSSPIVISQQTPVRKTLYIRIETESTDDSLPCPIFTIKSTKVNV